MRILYGVQCTGNGHLSRSREIIAGLRRKGHEIHVIFSGRDPALLSETKSFEPYTAFHGLYYVTSKGQIDYMATAQRLDFLRFARDLTSFDASRFDLAVTDFEPVTSRVARRDGIPSVAIGHQYAFLYDVPTARGNAIGRAVLRHAAPADQALGLHWHHFNQPILPPVVPSHLVRQAAIARKVLVYLPFENAAQVEQLLRPVRGFEFFIYGLRSEDSDLAHLHWRGFSRSGFLKDLQESEGVVCNAGFELPSEALFLGKKLLLKPLHGQMEQESNALALTQLRLGAVMNSLDRRAMTNWLDAPTQCIAEDYPDVAWCIVDWLDAGDWDDVAPLLRATWGPDAPVAAAGSPFRSHRAA